MSLSRVDEANQEFATARRDIDNLFSAREFPGQWDEEEFLLVIADEAERAIRAR